MFDKRYTENCRIYNMLKNAPKHLSFHTPGHKRAGWDITELSFSDNLSNPTGVLKEAQADIARILGAEKSFILTDGSTCGVLAMLYAAKVKKLVFPACSHKSVYNACKLLGIEKIILQNSFLNGAPQQPTAEEIEKAVVCERADGVLVTSPDYYGNIAKLKAISDVCQRHGCALLCDGAHGAHLRGSPLHASNYCDLWVDGAHKSLPAITQGAVVSAKGERFCKNLEEGVDIFRTSSPNYILMASVEYAVKYPVKERIIRAAEGLKKALRAYKNDDWSKIVIYYGENAQKANAFLESQGVYPEFCDGENIMFYLSPATPLAHLKKLKAILFSLEPLRLNGQKEPTMPAYNGGKRVKNTLLVPLQDGVGRTCAKNAGLFPPCIPVVSEGQIIEVEHIRKLQNAKNTYGLIENKITVYDNERKTD